jgi:hypothetical protein
MALLSCLVTATLFSSPAVSDSIPEARFVLRDLVTWLPGMYSSAPQVFLEGELGAPAGGPHGKYMIRVESVADENKNVARFAIDVDADASSAIGEKWTATATFDETAVEVRMSIQAAASGGCTLIWRRLGDQLRGFAAGAPCIGTSTDLDWNTEWVLDDGQLWMLARGRSPEARVLAGRDDHSHLRLHKTRRFECFASLQLDNGESQVINPFYMHDRGDQFVILTNEDPQRTLYVDFMHSLWPSRSGRNFRYLLRLTMYDGDPDDGVEDLLIGNGWAEPASDRVGWATAAASARCKLDPNSGQAIAAR